MIAEHPHSTSPNINNAHCHFLTGTSRHKSTAQTRGSNPNTPGTINTKSLGADDNMPRDSGYPSRHNQSQFVRGFPVVVPCREVRPRDEKHTTMKLSAVCLSAVWGPPSQS
ncbi:hypothetical protein RRG08_045714 [Elysia crispata]|uniref:Uncharacterized protein n=1 Tax=Elysia crispata TaxID=231223 RepID=A0AAE0Z436_9GAST|nr:hypothetical protein RRG08_045714 [Elysia crispata]